MNLDPNVTAICEPRRQKLEAQLAQQSAMEAIVAMLPPEVRECVWLNENWLQICAPTREQVRLAMDCLKAGKWDRNPTYGDPTKLDYDATVNGVLVCIHSSEPPASCRIETEEIEVPAHKEIVRKLVCK